MVELTRFKYEGFEMFDRKTIEDVEVVDKVVLVRVDYNVPIKDGRIENSYRILASLPTIKYLVRNGAKRIVLISHLGRPKGKIDLEFSLRPVAIELKKIVEKEELKNNDGQLVDVRFSKNVFGEDVAEIVDEGLDGDIVLLENLRFNDGEEENSKEFIRKIIDSTAAEIFVQDGFAVIHRAHASTSAITEELPSVAGFLVKREIETLISAITNVSHPMILIVGGAKVEDKQPLIEQFLPIADDIMVGGKIAADGYTTKNEKIYVAEDFEQNKNGIKLDIGKKTIAKMTEKIMSAETIIWNGTLGKTEEKPYNNGSLEIAKAIVDAGKNGAKTIICGGDTVSFVENTFHDNSKFTLVSTGGGASLELLLGKEMPGLIGLDKKYNEK